MSETNEESTVEQLEAFREVLVEERRRLVATALDLRRQNGDSGGENWGPQVKAIQEQIEAVDRAIADEKKLSPSYYESASVMVI